MGGFAIDPAGFSLSNEFGDPNFGNWNFGGDQSFSLGGDTSGGFDIGSQGFNLGVDPLMFQPPQQGMWDQIWQTFGGQPQAGSIDQRGIPTLQQGGPQQQGTPGLLSSLLGTGLPALGTGAGLAGIIQQMAQGRPTTTSQLRSTVQESPQQAQLTGQTLAALQNLQGLAHNAELQNAVKQLASGQLPISPDLVKQVTNAFGATAGNLAEGSIEDARNRGFSGGLGLLTGAGSPTYSRGLAQLQSDVSQALVNLALGLPTTAANIQNSMVNNAATPIQLSNALLGQLNQFQGLQGGQNQTTFGPKPNLLQSMQPLFQMGGALGQMGSNRAMFQPQQQQQAPNMSGTNTSLLGT